MANRVNQPADAYDAFAYAYDHALGRPFLRSIESLLDRLLYQYPGSEKTHLDVACGSGLALEFFRKRGFRSFGLDGSVPMLEIGRRRVAKKAFVADMRAFSSRRSFGLITCLYDSLNHLLEPSDVGLLLENIRNVMSHGSLLLFDINHPSAYDRIWGAEAPFVYHGHDYMLSMKTSYVPALRVAEAELTGWGTIGGTRVTISETRRQRAYEQTEITELMERTRLKVIDVIPFDPFEDGPSTRGDPTKLFFVGRCAPGLQGTAGEKR